MTPMVDGRTGQAPGRNHWVSEVEAIQSPALGAFLLWRMGAAFQTDSTTAPRMELHFLVLPLLFHAGTLTVIASTKPSSGLSKFVHKMLHSESELIAINARASALRDLTLASLSLGVATGLLAIEHETALVYSLDTNRKPSVAEAIKNMERGAERLGLWFARLPKEQVFSMMRVSY